MRLKPSTLAALIALAAAAPAAAETTTVQIDHTARLSLNGSAASVFTGNASIADVAIINRNTLMVIGRGYGVTNLVAVDSTGRTILDRQVQVSPGNAGRMTLYRGATPNNFTCSPTCERTPMPGEPGPGVFLPYNEPYLAYEKRQAEAAK